MPLTISAPPMARGQFKLWCGMPKSPYRSMTSDIRMSAVIVRPAKWPGADPIHKEQASDHCERANQTAERRHHGIPRIPSAVGNGRG